MWSNESFAGGHAPCVPSDGTPYFSVTPLGLPSVGVSFRQVSSQPLQTLPTEGIHLKVGETKSFQVGFYSDAPTDDWTLTATEGSAGRAIGGGGIGGGPGASSSLTIAIDHPTGRNGNKATVSVTLNTAPKKNAYTFVNLVSTDAATGKVHHFYPVVVSTN